MIEMEPRRYPPHYRPKRGATPFFWVGGLVLFTAFAIKLLITLIA